MIREGRLGEKSVYNGKKYIGINFFLGEKLRFWERFHGRKMKGKNNLEKREVTRERENI